ncbi:MAG: prolyl oligopeptidase family serine peptidase [Bryobacteraceae bacterium]|nr:prolyl oligopeptidase family serine peptidase [Bryobacteraceae bacterium]
MLALLALFADVHQHPGGKILPHDKYVHVVSEADSPVEQRYIKSKDGAYVAAAIRKPKGAGPFPALLYFHGAPGGRGMEKLVTWSRGDTGGPLWERFLQEGFVVAVADYRHPVGYELGAPMNEKQATYADDAVAVFEHLSSLPYVDKSRITVYGVSLGGSVTMHLLARAKPWRAILGAGAPMAFFGMSRDGQTIDAERTARNLATVSAPILLLVGTKDALLPVNRRVYEELDKAGKPARLDIFENGYHDFVAGPQGHAGRDEPLMDITLDALELALEWARGELK